MRRDQVIDARRELHLRQVAAAGEHDETSVRQRSSQEFGIRRRRRDTVFLALNHQQQHRKPGSERRARDGVVDTLEDRINGSMERSMKRSRSTRSPNGPVPSAALPRVRSRRPQSVRSSNHTGWGSPTPRRISRT
jgi:hypothetical protein